MYANHRYTVHVDVKYILLFIAC